MLADEPTSSLDPKTSVEIMELIADAGRRARHSGDRQHPQRRTRQALRPPHRRHVAAASWCSTARRQALEHSHLLEIYGGEGWLRMSDAAAQPRAARRLPAELAGAASACIGAAASTRLRQHASSTSPGRASSSGIEQRREVPRLGCFRPTSQPTSCDAAHTGMAESLQIAILATVVGVLLSLPLGPRCRAQPRARPASPGPCAHPDRAVPQRSTRSSSRSCSSRRSGFGALAGILALIVASIGFHRQAARRGDRGDVDEAGRGGARDRLAVALGNVLIMGGACRR